MVVNEIRLNVKRAFPKNHCNDELEGVTEWHFDDETYSPLTLPPPITFVCVVDV